MRMTRAAQLWGYLKPAAEDEGIVPPGPKVDAVDLALRAKIQAVRDDLQAARAAVLQLQADLEAAKAALQGKAPVAHTHTIAQVANLQQTLQGLAQRITALGG